MDDKQDKPKKEDKATKEDRTINASMEFILDGNHCEKNTISLKESSFSEMRENLIRTIQSKKDDEPGFLVIHGTQNNSLDFSMIPIKKILCAKLLVESIE